MSTNEKTILSDFGTSHAGSQNAGTWYATSGQPSPGQQQGESDQARCTRQSAYDHAKKTSSSGS
jgi:hypothetical protein